jgi:uncharacterized protein (DUF1697 family)
MSERQVALIRGINVGRAKRVAMADLRALVESLGHRDVRTLLNSGNVVYTADGTPPNQVAAAIEEGLASRIGVPARVIALSARQLERVVAENTLRDVATDPSRMMVAFLATPADRKKLDPLLKQDWAPDRLAVGTHAAYLWCPNSILDSPLMTAAGKALGDATTIRNWATVLKVRAALGE